jgi:hypothetical protein
MWCVLRHVADTKFQEEHWQLWPDFLRRYLEIFFQSQDFLAMYQALFLPSTIEIFQFHSTKTLNNSNKI